MKKQRYKLQNTEVREIWWKFQSKRKRIEHHQNPGGGWKYRNAICIHLLYIHNQHRRVHDIKKFSRC